MRREFTIQSKVDGLILDGLVVEPEEGVNADGTFCSSAME